MLSSTTYFTQNTSIFTSIPPLNHKKLIISSSSFASSAPNLTFSGKHYPGKHSVFLKNRVLTLHPMKESIKTRVLSGNSGDEEMGVLEQESLINGSSDFPPNLTPNALESTLNHLSKWFVAALFVSVILYRHDTVALWAALGSILNAGLSNILKQIFNQERPVSRIRPASASDPGMPSSHAQSIFFAVAFAIVSIVQWLGLNLLTVTLIGVLVAVGSYFSWLRVAQEFHTVSQVAVGAVLGSVFSVFWFWLWNAVMLKLFMSYLWVRISLVVCSVGCCFGFLVYLIRYWVIGAR